MRSRSGAESVAIPPLLPVNFDRRPRARGALEYSHAAFALNSGRLMLGDWPSIRAGTLSEPTRDFGVAALRIISLAAPSTGANATRTASMQVFQAWAKTWAGPDVAADRQAKFSCREKQPYRRRDRSKLFRCRS